jgi:nucleoside-diphosphate-sugar epimerase
MAQTDRVVILGGSGFIGRHLVEKMQGKVQSITVVSRNARGANGNGVSFVSGDVTDANRMMEIIKSATVVYQLTIEHDFELGVRNVAEACLAHKVRRLIFASTSAALYMGRKGGIDESAGPDPRPELRNPYSRGKVASEALLAQYRASKGLPTVIIRPCLVVGRGGKLAHGGLGIWRAPTCLIGPDNGDHPLPFVLVQDVASALLLAMDAPDIEGRAFNLAGDVTVTARQYVRLAADHTLRNFRYYPRSFLRLYGSAILKGIVKRVVGRKGPMQGYREIRSSTLIAQVDTTAAKQVLGWQPNKDMDVFIQEAIKSHVPPFVPGDLRLAR